MYITSYVKTSIAMSEKTKPQILEKKHKIFKYIAKKIYKIKDENIYKKIFFLNYPIVYSMICSDCKLMNPMSILEEKYVLIWNNPVHSCLLIHYYNYQLAGEMKIRHC